MAPVAEAHVPHQDFDQSFNDGFILWLLRTRGDHCHCKLHSQIRVPRVQIRIIEMALEHRAARHHKS